MPRKKKDSRQPETPPPPDEPASASQASDEAQQQETFPIVGIGASAGGLAAFEAFFSGMPSDTDPGMAFVLVQHLAPNHKSILTELVRRYTRMQVFEVEDGMEVKPNCTYIIPPNRDMAFLNGTLQLLEPQLPRGQRLPIDFFFRSLAQDQHERAICIVLSGTGSDGTQGVRMIKGEGGMVMAQNPESTEYDGMPRSAIATELVDFVLPPAEMAAQLLAYVGHAFAEAPQPPLPAAKTETTLKKIFVLLRAQTGHDFSLYKQNTIRRRVERRMAIHQIGQTDGYLRHLQQNPDEVDALFQDLLIGVTSFFRDTEAFAALQGQVIPRLLDSRPAGTLIRVWVPGCSTGEEAYSIAILLQEHMEALKKSLRIQVFATDIDSRAITKARNGVYPSGITADVTPERLARFFTSETDGSSYRIHNAIRDLLVFSEQDFIKDPPFSKLDLISCRNLLIYMGGELQRKIIPLLHYALNPGGYLLLGTSETVGEFADLFAALDHKYKLYQRQEDVHGAYRPAMGKFPPSWTEDGTVPRLPRKAPVVNGVSLRNLTERALLLQYAPASALVNGQGDILYLHGRTGLYLEPAPGEAGMNILKMAREGLRRHLTLSLHKAVADKESVCHTGLRVRTNGDFTTVNLTVSPMPAGLDADGGASSLLFLVIFEEAPASDHERDGKAAATDAAEGAGESAADVDARIAELKQELRAKDEYLQTTNEELETSNEDLKSSNEEMQSVNEELQSTNEELETSKEELQSINEELATVNVELQNKVSDLSKANNDMNNLLGGTGIGTVFVDHQLHILRFTPAVAQVLNLIQTDLGRPVGHVVSNLVGYDRLTADTQEVLASLIHKEIEVQTKSHEWYSLRIQPYRTLENVIEGAVITFVDITERKRLQAALLEAALLEAQAKLAKDVVATVRESMLVLDDELRVVFANSSFYSAFQVEPDKTEGCLVYELGNRQWDIPALRRLLEQILPLNHHFNDFKLTHNFPGIGQRTMLLNARRVFSGTEKAKFILLSIEDTTGRKSKAKAGKGEEEALT